MPLKEILEKAAGLTVGRLEIHNPQLLRPGVPFAFQDPANPRLELLRKQYRLDEAVADGKTHLEKVLLLRNWVHRTIPRGDEPAHSILDPFAILDTALEGGAFYCTHYAFVFVCCALSLGWTARKIAVDRYHEPDQDSWHHGVAEVYLHDFDKWMVVDPMFDIHYELGGVPLNAIEIRGAVLNSEKQKISRRHGPGRERYSSAEAESRFDSPECYFWSLVPSRSDFFNVPWNHGGVRSYIFRDGHNKGRIWYQGKGSEGKSYPHTGYKGSFIDVESREHLYPTIGRVHLEFAEPKDGVIEVEPSTFMPGFSHFQWLMDDNPHTSGREPGRESVRWRPHAGPNLLSVAVVNLLGVGGAETRIEAELR